MNDPNRLLQVLTSLIDLHKLLFSNFPVRPYNFPNHLYMSTKHSTEPFSTVHAGTYPIRAVRPFFSLQRCPWFSCCLSCSTAAALNSFSCIPTSTSAATALRHPGHPLLTSLAICSSGVWQMTSFLAVLKVQSPAVISFPKYVTCC